MQIVRSTTVPDLIRYQRPVRSSFRSTNFSTDQVASTAQTMFRDIRHCFTSPHWSQRLGQVIGQRSNISSLRWRMLDIHADILKKHGLTADRMKVDLLFFFNLLFPFGSPSASGIEDDHACLIVPTLPFAPTSTRACREVA